MTLPTLTVLLDDGTGTFPTNITSKVLALDGYEIGRGRGDWQGAVTAGDLRLTLNNSDGRFTPGSTTLGTPSPITVDQRIRLKETVNGVTYTRFTGYVKSWPVSWPATVVTFSIVPVTATDAQARAERRPLRSMLEEEILLRSPSVYYTLGEPEGSTAAGDTSGNQAAVLEIVEAGAALTFGAGTGPTDGLTSATFANGDFLSDNGTATVTVPTTYSMVDWFTTTTPLGSLTQGQGDLGWEMSLNGSGEVRVFVPGAGSGLITGPVVTDGSEHCAIATGDGVTATLYVDGVSVGTRAIGAPNSAIQELNLGVGFTGTIAHVATYTTALSAADALAIYQAGSSATESGTARITRLAGYAGIPVGTLDSSLTNVPRAALTGKSAQAAIQEVADAEMGVVYLDGNGNLTFHNRERVSAKTAPDLILDRQWVTPDVQPVVDDQQIINYFETKAEGTGATSLVNATASETTHGRYAQSQTYLVQTDAEALDRARWIVDNFDEPAPRYGTLTINLYGMTAAQASTVLAALDLDCWLRVTSLASQNPGGTTADVVVQGWRERCEPESTKDPWTITCNVVARSLYNAWILGSSTYGVLDSTTKLGV